MSNKLKKVLNTKIKIWITLVSAVIVLAAAVSSFYYFYYLRPNFRDSNFNYISCDTDKTVEPEDEITYTINYKNTGNCEVRDFSVIAYIPKNTSYQYCDSTGKYNSNDNIIKFEIGDLCEGGEGRASYAVKINTPLDNGTAVKSGEIIFEYEKREKRKAYKLTEGVESIISSSPEFSEFNVETVDGNRGLLSVGDKVTFIVNVENAGNMNASSVGIINNFPSKLDVLEDSISSGGKYDSSNESITWELDKIKAGEKKEFRYSAIVGDDFDHLELFENTFEVIYEERVRNKISVKESVWAYPDFSQSTVTVVDTNGGDTWAWDTLMYIIRVKNTGKRSGKNIRVICPVPEGTGYIIDTANKKGFYYDNEKRQLQWNIFNIEVGEEKDFSFNVTIGGHLTGGGQIDTKFYIEGDGTEFEIIHEPVILKPYIFQTIVCMGDSQIIRSEWPDILDELLESKYPYAEFNTVSKGIAGEMVIDAIKRFDTDVRSNNPQIIILGFGSNDAGAGTGFFRHHMEILIDQAKSTGALVLVHGTGYIDTSGIWSGKEGYQEYNDILKDYVCPNNNVAYIDIYSKTAGDPDKYLDSDGMHWSDEGGELVANLVYQTLIGCLDEDGKVK